VPGIPFADMVAISKAVTAPHLKSLPTGIAVWLATVAHIRHVHSSYEKMLEEGYDRDSARHFVIPEINDTLGQWRSTRRIDAADDLDTLT
jgi:hypothetical protein